MGLHEIKKLLHNNMQGPQKLNCPKINDPRKKWANELTELFQRKKSK
jgi:hypothetical protein